MPPLTQTSSYCWPCQFARFHVTCYDRLSQSAPDKNIFLYANVNLELVRTAIISIFLTHLFRFLIVINLCFILLW